MHNMNSMWLHGRNHQSDVIMSAMASQISSLTIFLNRLFRRRSKKTSKLRVTGLCAGNSPVAGEFPAQMANNAEIVSIWWRHHVRNNVWSNIPNKIKMYVTWSTIIMLIKFAFDLTMRCYGLQTNTTSNWFALFEMIISLISTLLLHNLFRLLWFWHYGTWTKLFPLQNSITLYTLQCKHENVIPSYRLTWQSTILPILNKRKYTTFSLQYQSTNPSIITPW